MTCATTNDAVILPDDPRDCCRAALKIIIAEDFDKKRQEAADALEIAWTALAYCTYGAAPTAELARMLARAGEAMTEFTASLDRVRELVRHGTGDHREMDARHAERVKALNEGREPPYEPTGFEVRGAMIAAKASGNPISEDSAIAMLKQEHSEV